MTGRLPRLDRKGSVVVEYALTVPVLLALLFGTIQAGILFIAVAGLKHAVGEAARTATLWPPRTDQQLTQAVRDKAFGINPANLTVNTVARGEARGTPFVDISASYTVPMDFFVIRLPAVTFEERRRVYVP
jgi:Flp pilus assembly protein TadG